MALHYDRKCCLLTEPYTEYQLRVRAETGGGYSNFSDLFPALTDVEGKNCLSTSKEHLWLVEVSVVTAVKHFVFVES